MIQEKINYLKRSDDRLAKVIDYFGTLRIDSRETDSFGFLTREIVGQMISARVKKVIFARLLNLCDYNLTPENISIISVDNLRQIGLSSSKARFIKNLAEIILKNNFDFESLKFLNDEEILLKLKQIDGVGNWTAKMYLIFFLQRENVLPFEDGAFIQSYKWLYNKSDISPRSIIKTCSPWKPYSSLAARYLYMVLDNGLTKTSIENFLANGKDCF